MRVENMTSPRTGKEVANQFIITDNQGNRYFQSYQTIIAKKERSTGKVWLNSNYWDYSATTSKYRNKFLGENKKETQRKIDNGTYTLVDSFDML